MGLDLFKMLVLVTVIDRNGYSAAAEHLGISQATVSFHIRSLERTFQAPLVRYERRAVSLTPVGKHVYQSARAMLREQQRLTRVIGGAHSGQVKVGLSMAFEKPYFFDKVVAPFRHSHRDVLLTLRFGHSITMADAVLDHDLDLAYIIGWHVPSGLRYEPLHRAVFRFVVASDHPLARQKVVTIDDIAKSGLIAAPLDHVEWAHYEDVLHEIGLGADDVALEVDGIQARVLATRAGQGVFGTFYPRYAGSDPYEGLTPLCLDRPAPSVEMGLVIRRTEVLTKCAHTFANCLRQMTLDDTDAE